ncbi:unnamed protein product [Kluyveromyces dobzhanskii CBS 2104]|uniref:WGS project CCBQ000000000 data, contig 00011 n=1 Tax=Kluyveromyces dobzhanskii CBS 2104 TaxID=1427455 RepID=A0A0A8L9L5_9SACH|nr:unnamed protein product [Kluyveromyces dobzhanskii CBS 2104]
MNDGFSTPGTPAKTFETPTRPLSQQQFQSLRERAIKQSPSLYKHKVLSDPTRKVEAVKVQATPAFSGKISTSLNVREAEPVAPANARPVFTDKRDQWSVKKQTARETSSDLLPDEPLGQQDLIESNFSGDSAIDKLTDFENPALATFTSRMVNKELEMRRLLTNVVVVLIWNLISKFVFLFFHFTTSGAQLRNELYRFMLKNIVYKVNPQANLNSFWFNLLSWQFATSLFHTIVLYNIASCLWNLLVKAQNLDMSDLHLTEHQKSLLGITEETSDSGFASSLNVKNRNFDLAGNKDANSAFKSLNEVGSKSGNKPFIFKSLQTPMKMRELNSVQQAEARKNHVSFSLQPKKVNAFGIDPVVNNASAAANSATLARSQPGTHPGYIPSNRYTYMMDSPSSMKKR